MKVRDMNEELINELNFVDIKKKAMIAAMVGTDLVKNGIITLGNSLKKKAVKVFDILNGEFEDNGDAFKVLSRKWKSVIGDEVQPTPEEMQEVLDQMNDNAKMVILGALAVAPGSPITIPIVMKIAEKMNVTLTVKSGTISKKNLPTL